MISESRVLEPVTASFVDVIAKTFTRLASTPGTGEVALQLQIHHFLRLDLSHHRIHDTRHIKGYGANAMVKSQNSAEDIVPTQKMSPYQDI